MVVKAHSPFGKSRPFYTVCCGSVQAECNLSHSLPKRLHQAKNPRTIAQKLEASQHPSCPGVADAAFVFVLEGDSSADDAEDYRGQAEDYA